MTTYGQFPGVKVSTSGGAITSVSIGAETNLLIFGDADLESGTATANDPTQVRSQRDADAKFGSGSELSNAIKDALSNGANVDFLYAIAVDELGNTETFSGAQTGTLAEAPIVEDLSALTVGEDTSTDGNYDTDISVEFHYDGTPSTPSDGDTVFLNPFTGEWAADASGDYEFVYDYYDYQSALDAADSVVSENETGVYAILEEAERVGSMLSAKVDTLRQDYKMVTGVMAAQPNDNSSESPPGARYDTLNYTDDLDNDTLFLIAPARYEDDDDLIVGAVGGLFAGNDLDDSVFNEEIIGLESLEEEFTRSEAQEMVEQEVIPVRNVGSYRLRDNLSTSTAEDWQRDYWRRRIVDQVILIAKELGERMVGKINSQSNRQSLEEEIVGQLQDLVADGVLQDDYFVDVYEDGVDTVAVDFGITPQGVAKRIDTSITINT